MDDIKTLHFKNWTQCLESELEYAEHLEAVKQSNLGAINPGTKRNM